MDIKEKKSLQFELWQTCNSRCKFCVIPDTKILMADYSTKNIQDIKPGDMVLGVSKERTRFNLVPTKVLNIGSRDYTGEIYGKFTAEHPILATHPSRKKYVLAKNSQSQIKINLIKIPNTNSVNYEYETVKGRLPKNSYQGKVYNFETETNNYIADNIVVHNCYLGESNLCTPIKLKLKAVNDAIAFLSDEEKIAPYNTVSYIGGEFFQGQLDTPELKDRFFDLMRKTAELQINGKIQEVWIMCTLTIGDQQDLYTSLNILKDAYAVANKPELMNQVWIVTSYDTIGRFHTEKMKTTWESTMLNLHTTFPELKFNTTSILTQDLIQKYLNNEFSFKAFSKKFNTALFFKQPSPGSIKLKNPEDFSTQMDRYREMKRLMEEKLPGFFPKRADFLQFLIKLQLDCPDLYNKLFNIVYRADDLYRNYNDEEENHRMQKNHRAKELKSEIEELDSEVNPINTCGHQLNYSAYIDSDACMICDREIIRA